MKHFDPQARLEPEEFRAWKRQELDQLVAIYKSKAGQGRALYGHLPSSLPLPAQREADIAYFSKQELAQALVEEQGYLCCFCNRIFDFDQVAAEMKDQINSATGEIEEEYLSPAQHEQAELPLEIEHVAPVTEFPKRALDYSNLLASCHGGRRKRKKGEPRQRKKSRKNLSCNASKGDQPLPITPFDPDCESRIFFAENGDVLWQRGDVDAQKTVEVLNLAKFNEDREATIAGFIYADKETRKLISKEKAKKMVEEMNRKRSDGKYHPFCSAVASVLKREILKTEAP